MNDTEQNVRRHMAAPLDRGRSMLAKIRQILQDELFGLQPRLLLANALAAPLPIQAGGRLRAATLRAAGFRIGRDTVIYGRPTITGSGDIYPRLIIGCQCHIEIDCTLDLEERITIGDRVTIGHQVMILTSSHEIGTKERRAGVVVRTPVTIGDGAWIGPRCVILPGVTVGAGAVVAAAALVNKHVPPNSFVAGSPAQVVEEYGNSISDRGPGLAP